MNKGTVLILVLAVGVGAYVLGSASKKGDNTTSADTQEHSAPAEKTAAADKNGAPTAPADGVERYRVPLEGTPRGAHRQGEHRRFFGLPVSVLQPRHTHPGSDHEGLQRAGASLLQAQSAPFPL